MRYFLPVLLCMFMLITGASAQSNLPEFGVITPSEIQLKEISFDKEADAVILFDDAFTDYGDEYTMITMRRIRIKILNEKGIERGNIIIPFYSGEKTEYIGKVDGATYNFDESGKIDITRLDKKSVYTEKRDNYISYMKFALPKVRAGSIIEYLYTTVNKNFNPRLWIFQSEMPTLKSSYLLQIPPNAEFTYSVSKKKNYNIIIKPLPDIGRVYFEMNNIAGLRHEPYMDAMGDFVQRVYFQFSGMTDRTGSKHEYNNTWRSVAYDLITDKQFGSQLDKSLKSDEIKSFDQTKSAGEKVNLIYRFVRDNITWDGYYGKYISVPLRDILEKKKGDAAEMNLLLINLLKTNGIDAKPMLVAERQFGKIDTTYPFLDRFNKVVAFVIADGKQYILDATQKFTPAELVPLPLLNTTGFIVDKNDYRLVRIGSAGKSALNKIRINAVLDSKGEMKGHTEIQSSDYARESRTAGIKKDEKEFVNDNFIKPHEGISIDSFKVSNLDEDSKQLSQQFDFKIQLNESGNFILLDYNLFTGLKKNPFVSSIRFTDVNFGYPSMLDLEFSVELPAGAKIEEVPKPLQLDLNNGAIRMTREVKQENNTLVVKIIFSQSVTFVPADSYFDLKEYYKQIVEALNEAVVIKLK